MFLFNNKEYCHQTEMKKWQNSRFCLVTNIIASRQNSFFENFGFLSCCKVDRKVQIFLPYGKNKLKQKIDSVFWRIFLNGFCPMTFCIMSCSRTYHVMCQFYAAMDSLQRLNVVQKLAASHKSFYCLSALRLNCLAMRCFSERKSFNSCMACLASIPSGLLIGS